MELIAVIITLVVLLLLAVSFVRSLKRKRAAVRSGKKTTGSGFFELFLEVVCSLLDPFH